MKSMQQIKNRAEREGGQVLVTESNAQGSSGLHDLSSGNINNIPQSGKKSNPDLEFSRKRLHLQINPIMRDGKVRDEYADLLANKEYTPTTLKELQDKALEWIFRRGGIVPAAEDFILLQTKAEILFYFLFFPYCNLNITWYISCSNWHEADCKKQ